MFKIFLIRDDGVFKQPKLKNMNSHKNDIF